MLSHRKGVLLDGIGSELVRASTGGSRKTLSKWLGDLSSAINLGDVASTFTSGDATPSVLNNSKFITDGSTTITNFDDGVEGQTITVYRGSSDIGIADNATIDPIIAGTLTLSTARPSATFRLASGVWKQVEEAGSIATALLPVVQAATLALALTAAGIGTGDSPQFAGVNIGHASDTTLTRVSAGVAAIEGDTIATWAAANTLSGANIFTHATGNTFRGRINSDTAFLTYDLGSSTQATLVDFGSASVTVAASKQADLIYAGNTFVVGSAGRMALINYNLTASASSHATSNHYAIIGAFTNAGPGTVKGQYSRVIGSGSSTGVLAAFTAGVDPGASTSLAIGLQISPLTTARKMDYGIYINQGLGGTASIDYGFLAASDVSVAEALVQGFAVGAGNFLRWKNAAGSADLWQVLSTGAQRFTADISPVIDDGGTIGTTALKVSDIFMASGAVVNFNSGNYTLTHSAGLLTANAAFTGTILTGSTSVIAASSSNGMTLSQAALTRNNAAGSMTIAAGTNAGNSIAFQTGGSARFSVSDSGASFTGDARPASDNAYDLGTTTVSWRAAYLTDGLYVDDVRVVKEQGALVADASGGAVIDAEARTAINALLARIRAHGLIAT